MISIIYSMMSCILHFHEKELSTLTPTPSYL